jgi:glutaredoxin-related protein
MASPRVEFWDVYVSGDKGSQELLEMLMRKGVSHRVHDIRRLDEDGQRSALRTLLELRLNTVPQVFADDGTYVGDFDIVYGALSRLATLHVLR